MGDGSRTEGVSCESDFARSMDVHYVFEGREGCGGGVEVLQFLTEVEFQDTVMNGA